jgi:hypothetical protein
MTNPISFAVAESVEPARDIYRRVFRKLPKVVVFHNLRRILLTLNALYLA